MSDIVSYGTDTYKSQCARLRLYFSENFQNARTYIQNRKKPVANLNSRFQDIANLLLPGKTFSFGIAGIHLKDLVNNLYVVGYDDVDNTIDKRVIRSNDVSSMGFLKRMKCENAIMLTGDLLNYKTFEEISDAVAAMAEFVVPGGRVIFEINPSRIQYNRFNTVFSKAPQTIIDTIKKRTAYDVRMFFPAVHDKTRPIIFLFDVPSWIRK